MSAIRPLYASLATLIGGVFAASFILPSGVSAGALFGMATGAFALGMVFLLRDKRIAPLFFLIALFLLGAGRTRFATVPRADDVSRWAGGPSLWVRGVVTSEGEPKPFHTVAFTFRASRVNDYQSVWLASGNLSVFAPAGSGKSDAPLLRPGDTVWLRGKLSTPPGQTNPDGFDYHTFLARRGIWATLSVRRPADVRPIRAGENGIGPIPKAALWVRAKTERTLATHLPPDDAALLGGLLLSLRGNLSADMQDAFVRTGTVHILSVSGLHIAALAWLVKTLLGILGLRPKAVAVVTICLLAFAALASGGSAAATRSVACASLLLAAPLLKRTVVDYVHLLGVAALGLVLLDPLILFDSGAQLSFATVGFLLLVMPLVSRHWFPLEAGQTHFSRVINRYLLQALLVGVVAEMASGPLTAYHFNRVSFIAPLANVLAVPLSEGLVAGGLATVGASLVLPDFLTAPFWGLLHLGLCLLRWTVSAFASLPHISPSVQSPPVVFLWMYYFALGGGIAFVKSRMGQKTFFAPPSSP